MRFYLGVTDTDWFEQLRSQGPEDINFWQPSGRALRGLGRGEPFLFKLKAPYRKIGGAGFLMLEDASGDYDEKGEFKLPFVISKAPSDK